MPKETFTRLVPENKISRWRFCKDHGNRHLLETRLKTRPLLQVNDPHLAEILEPEHVNA